MNHEAFSAKLEAYVDGELPPVEEREFEAHARDCAACVSALAAADQLVERTRALRREIQPSRDLWPEVRAGLGGARPRVVLSSVPRRRGRGWRRRVRIGTAAAAAAAAAAYLATRGPHEGSATSPRGDAFALVLSGLEQECMGAGKSLQASLRVESSAPAQTAAWTAGVASGVSILDLSIDETRAALAAQPGDPELQRLLAERYRQKLALLQTALLRVEHT
jgi:anti-sigma factor RsiW